MMVNELITPNDLVLGVPAPGLPPPLSPISSGGAGELSAPGLLLMSSLPLMTPRWGSRPPFSGAVPPSGPAAIGGGGWRRARSFTQCP